MFVLVITFDILDRELEYFNGLVDFLSIFVELEVIFNFLIRQTHVLRLDIRGYFEKTVLPTFITVFETCYRHVRTYTVNSALVAAFSRLSNLFQFTK